MKVRIVKHTPIAPIPWWYKTHIGEVFEVFENETMPDLYKTNGNGPGASNIMKCDCEAILLKATEPTESPSAAAAETGIGGSYE